MRVLIDTCVIIDALQSRKPFSEEAQKVFIAVANKQLTGYVTAKSITDIYYLTHKVTHSDEETRKILKTLLSLFDICDTTAIDCRKALTSQIADYEDAVMCESAVRYDMDGIVTRNIKDYQKSEIKIYTPKEITEYIENQD